MTDADTTNPVEATIPSRSPSVAELQSDIEQTRDELAATVAALAAKANRWARARKRFARMGMRRRGGTHHGAYIAQERGRNSTGTSAYLSRQGVMLIGAVGVAAIAGWLLIRRKRG